MTILRLVLIFSALTAPGVYLSAQESKPLVQRQVVLDLQKQADSILSKSGQFGKIDAKAFETIGMLTQHVAQISEAGARMEMPKTYLLSLHGDVRLLEKAATAERVTKKEYDMVKDVETDTAAKNHNIQHNPKNPFELVAIATTKDNSGTPVSHLYVYYVPKGLEDEPSNTRFPKESTPTDNLMPPGNWVMWTQSPDDSSRLGKRQTIEVKDRGNGRCPFDLPAP